jgi:serine/threonine protein kinase
MAEATLEAEVPQEPEVREIPSISSGGHAILYDRFIISTDTTIPDLDTPSAKAYNAEDRREAGSQLFALICTPGLPVREDVVHDLKANEIPGILNLVDWGKVFWPPLNQIVMVIIYHRPMGGKVTASYDASDFRITEYDMPTKVIKPLAEAIKELAARKITHRAIRPNNLFYMDEARTQIALGDCVTTPPGFDQPVVFDALPAAMASSGGRGTGGIKDDLFSLGVTIMYLLLGENPIAELGTDEQVVQRANRGSYQILLKNTRLPVKMTEVLRGLLKDEAEERWGTGELDTWIEGKRPAALARKSLLTADAALKFGGYELVSPRAVAHALTKDVSEAAKIIKNGQLETWARSDLKLSELADTIKEIAAVAEANVREADSKDDFIVTKVSLLMDPTGPIRYRGFSFMPEAFGSAMAVEFLQQKENNFSAVVLQRKIGELWFASQEFTAPGNFSFVANFKELQNLLKKGTLGFGIERCLYEENHALPCQSPNIALEYVTNISEILPALDRAANRADTSGKPVDRHIAAFIATHFELDIEPQLAALANPDEAASLIGMLSLLALVQWKLEGDPVYGLSSWMGGLLGPAINTYYNRGTRRKIEQKIPKLVRQGSLSDLFDLIDNAERRAIDTSGFAEAQTEYTTAEEEVRELTEGEEARSHSAESSGHHAAAVASFLFMVFIVTLLFAFG